jgi:hypothetical protein
MRNQRCRRADDEADNHTTEQDARVEVAVDAEVDDQALAEGQAVRLILMALQGLCNGVLACEQKREQTGFTERDEDRFVAQLLAQILDGEGALPERMILLRRESAEPSDRQRTQRMLGCLLTALQDEPHPALRPTLLPGVGRSVAILREGEAAPAGLVPVRRLGPA